MKQANSEETSVVSIPELEEAENLAHDLKQVLVRFEQELAKGDGREGIEKLEIWVKSYLKGLRAAQKISSDGAAMLNRIRDQLKLALDERQRLASEGGNPPPNAEKEAQLEEFTKAIHRIERLIPTVEQSFQYPLKEEGQD